MGIEALSVRRASHNSRPDPLPGDALLALAGEAAGAAVDLDGPAPAQDEVHAGLGALALDGHRVAPDGDEEHGEGQEGEGEDEEGEAEAAAQLALEREGEEPGEEAEEASTARSGPTARCGGG